MSLVVDKKENSKEFVKNILSEIGSLDVQYPQQQVFH